MKQQKNILSVGEVTKSIKSVLEESFDDIYVIGELSNFKNHFSGHWYFSLKDADAQISCVMWKSYTPHVFFTPQDGMKIVVHGKISVYPPRGNYQIDVRSMQPAGVGELQLAFEMLKQKLSNEGLFDEERKRPIPLIPTKIGIVTSIDGAAFKDMVSVAKRRYPLVELVISPSKVQGAGAAESIVDALQYLQKHGDVDVIIVGRGGGSIEDLWSFNEEIVARAIAASKIPVISGVGHEIDFTIADFVSDLRAPTPTAAMEMATPDRENLIEILQSFQSDTTAIITNLVVGYKQEMKSYSPARLIQKPFQLINFNYQRLDHTMYKFFSGMEKIQLQYKNKLALLQATIKSYDVQRTLKKGFVLVRQQGKFVKTSADLLPHHDFELMFHDNNIPVKQQ